MSLLVSLCVEYISVLPHSMLYDTIGPKNLTKVMAGKFTCRVCDMIEPVRLKVFSMQVSDHNDRSLWAIKLSIELKNIFLCVSFRIALRLLLSETVFGTFRLPLLQLLQQ